MRTLYLRNVPEEVARQLERLADRAGMSVNAFAVRELAQVARRAANPELLGALPDYAVVASELVADLEEGRAER